MEATDRSSQSTLEPPASPAWAGLPRDLLAEISSHLCDAVDFVRFHAVCRQWREAVPPLLFPASAYPRLRPWLLTISNGLTLHLPLNYGRSLPSRKTSSYRIGYDGVRLPGGRAYSGYTNLVASADGKAAWLFRAQNTQPTLVDILTGTLTPLPWFPFPINDQMNQWLEKPRGIVYGDGTVFMYNVLEERDSFYYTLTFMAAILRTGEAAWKLVKRSVDWTSTSHLSIVYHDGKILACAVVQFGLLLNLDMGGSSGDDVGDGWINWDSEVQAKYDEVNYVFELQGELMRATILVDKSFWYRGDLWVVPTFSLSVVVHALEGVDGDGKMRWLVRDGQSLMDHVLFLAPHASLAVDAAHLGLDGGCAYFVFRNHVFSYSLIDRECQLMERLRPWWDSVLAHLWIQPRPAIAPVHKVQETLKVTAE